MQHSESEIEVLENVERYFEKNGGRASRECLIMAKTAVAKARNGQYGTCSSCGHKANIEEIRKRPFFCAKCGKPFV